MAELESRVNSLEQVSRDLAFSLMRMEQSLEKSISEMKENTAKLGAKIDKQIQEMREESKRADERVNKEIGAINKQIKEMHEESKRAEERVNKQIGAINKQIKEMHEESKRAEERVNKQIGAINKQIKEVNRQWGNLANRLGTIVEDLVFPSFHIVVEETFGLKNPDDIMIRRKKYLKKRRMRKEFDLIAVYHDDKTVFLNETKSVTTDVYIDRFVEFVSSGEFFTFFPEFKEMKLVPVFSSLALSDEHVEMLTESDILAMHIEGSILEFKNSKEVRGTYGL